MSSRKFLVPLLLVIAVIMHGSLYPYDFHRSPGGPGPLHALLRSWADQPSSYGDIIANLLLYVPFGFFGAQALPGGRLARLVVLTLLGLALCTGVELAQYYDAGRVTNMSDLYLNTFGSALGAAAAIVFADAALRLERTDTAAGPIPVMLLLAMLGYHLFPYVPTIDLHKYWRSLQPLLLSPHISSVEVLRYTALWLTTSYLIGAITGFGRSRVLAPLAAAAVFAAKVSIESLIVSPSEVVGAALALALWLVMASCRGVATLLTALLLCAAIVTARLQPFRFQAAPRAFGWLPFRSFLGGSLGVNTVSLMEKFFYYGSFVWLVAEAGLPLWLSTSLAALLLFATSFAETYLPGRSAEITDALIVVIIGVLMAPMRRRERHVEPAAR